MLGLKLSQGVPTAYVKKSLHPMCTTSLSPDYNKAFEFELLKITPKKTPPGIRTNTSAATDCNWQFDHNPY